MSAGSEALGAVDLFHLHTHRELLAQGLSGNGCAMVAVLEGRVDVPRLERRLRRALSLVEALRWQLGRDRWLRPAWKSQRHASVPVVIHPVSGEDPWVESTAELLDEQIGGDHPWHIDVLRGEVDDAVVLRWFHPLTDARGASRLLAWLGSDVEDEAWTAPPAEELRLGPERLLDGMGLRERLDLANAYLRHVLALSRTPIVSLYGAAASPRPGRARLARLVLDEEVTRELYRSLRKRAKLADTSVILFAAARLLDRALAARGRYPEQLLVPVPLSLDAKKDSTRMLGNHLTMMMLSLGRDDLADEARAVASLAAQRRAIVRERLDAGMIAALEMAGKMPSALYNWAACRPFGGERSSMVVSNPGELPLEGFLGATVRDAFSAPTVLARPGLQVIADRHRGRLGVLVVYREGLIGAAEIRELLPALERDLLGA